MNINTPFVPSAFDELDDPDNAKAPAFPGQLVISAHVDIGASIVRPSYDPVYGPGTDKRILEVCKAYGEKSHYDNSVWYLEAVVLDAVYSDGNPVRRHEVLKLRNSDGRAMHKGQAPAQLAAAFIELGFSASYTQLNQPTSALGRKFVFEERDVGRKPYTKTLRLWPVEILPDSFQCEQRVVTSKNDRSEEDRYVPADGNVHEAPAEAEVVATLVSIFAGHKPAEMLDLLLAEPKLRNVSAVFGVPLLEAATDESLATVLQENGVMVISGGGVLQPV